MHPEDMEHHGSTYTRGHLLKAQVLLDIFIKKLFHSSELTPLLYVALMLGALAIASGRAFLFANLLGKASYGYYSMAERAAAYFVLAISFGLDHGLLREGSIAYGKGAQAEIARLRNCAAVAVLFSALVYGLIGLTVFYFVWPSDQNYQTALMLSIILATSLLEYRLFSTYLRVVHNPTRYAFFLFMRNAIVVLIGCMAASWYGFEAIILVECAASLILGILIFFLDPGSFRSVDTSLTETIITLIKVGFPLMCGLLIRNLTITLDGWFVAFSLGPVAFGEYAFSMLTMSLGTSALSIITLILGPKWIAQYSATGSLSIIFRNIHKTSLLIVGVLIIFFVPIFIFAPFMIQSFFPDFVNVYPIILIIYSGVVFYMANQYEWVFFSVGQGSRLIRIYSCTFVIVFLSCILGIYLKQGLAYFAVVFAVGRLISILFTYICARKIVKIATLTI